MSSSKTIADNTLTLLTTMRYFPLVVAAQAALATATAPSTTAPTANPTTPSKITEAPKPFTTTMFFGWTDPTSFGTHTVLSTVSASIVRVDGATTVYSIASCDTHGGLCAFANREYGAHATITAARDTYEISYTYQIASVVHPARASGPTVWYNQTVRETCSVTDRQHASCSGTEPFWVQVESYGFSSTTRPFSQPIDDYNVAFSVLVATAGVEKLPPTSSGLAAQLRPAMKTGLAGAAGLAAAMYAL
jgi:hypothetical protein